MACIGNVGGDGLSFVSSCSGGNDDVVGRTIRAVGGEDRIPGASILSKL